MPHYVLWVYTRAGYRPDMGLRSLSRTRAERRARLLQRDGFRTELTVDAPPARSAPSTAPPARKPT
jgi:hypothetical protein